MITKTVTQIILTAEEGFVLTDGESYGKTVILPENADAGLWREIRENELPEEVKENV